MEKYTLNVLTGFYPRVDVMVLTLTPTCTKIGSYYETHCRDIRYFRWFYTFNDNNDKLNFKNV